MISKDYRVLGLYDKSYNKWFMTGERKPWRPRMKAEDKKKYKMAICMMEDGGYKEFDDIALTDGRYNLKDICKIVDGNDIVAVKGRYKPSPV